MSILAKIVNTKREEIQAARSDRPESELRAALADAPPVRDFFSRLRAGGPIKLIAEVKKASPSAGVIRPDFNPADIASTYEGHGATCISVLTDGPYFQGSLSDLRQVRDSVELPLLRKDFIVDSYQLLEARLGGADAVLLIAECLEDYQLRNLLSESLELGMTPLVELYDPNNLDRVLDAGAMLLGVNNRDLHTFKTDLKHTLEIRNHVPDDRILVAESGIRTRADVLQLESAGVDAVLVGESLMSSPDIGAAVDALLGRATES